MATYIYAWFLRVVGKRSFTNRLQVGRRCAMQRVRSRRTHGSGSVNLRWSKILFLLRRTRALPTKAARS